MSSHENNLRKYILLDASVVAAYYVPEAAERSARLAARARTLIESVKSDLSNSRRLLIPNICIPEVFSTFAKYRFGKWNKHVKTAIDDLKYWRARLQFHHDIHNGKYIQQLELSRYHILATDLISPVDHYYEYYRQRNKNIRKVPMGAFDHTIIGMGIALVKSRGVDHVLLVTGDRRMGHILGRAKRIKRQSAAKLGLLRTAKDLGLVYVPHIYPDAINLATASEADLAKAFGEWPLAAQDIARNKRTKLTKDQKRVLVRLYKRLTDETSESLTYTDEFEVLYEAFVSQTGLDMGRAEVWRGLSNLRKQGELPRKHMRAKGV